MVITVINQKGGVGKTIIAMNLVGALARRGQEVLVIDADPQASALTWWAAAGENPFPVPVVGMPRPILHKEIPQLIPKYQTIVIDCPPALGEIARSALMAADLAIIPVQPAAVDLWSVRGAAQIIEEARLYCPELQAVLLLSRLIPHTRLAQEAREALQGLKIPLLASTISQRVALAEAPLAGQLIFDYAKSSPAVEEFERLAQEILEVRRHGARQLEGRP